MKKRMQSIVTMIFLSIFFSVPIMAQEKIYEEHEVNDEVVIRELGLKPQPCKKNEETGKCGGASNCLMNERSGECYLTRQIIGQVKPARLPVKITFETNSAELTPKAKHVLDIVGRNIKESSDFKFVIEGHADLRGSFELNQRLSTARAQSVMSYFINKHGIDPSKLSAIGKSYTELADHNNPTSSVNRRVVISKVFIN